MFKKGILKDFSLNIVSTIISTLSSQLIIYPFISRIYGATKFSQMLTIMAVVNIIAVVIGGSLNNIRLVEHSNDDSDVYNYNIIFILSALLGSLVGCILLVSLKFSQLGIELPFIFLLIFLTSFRSYATVFFRLRLNYINILVHTCITAGGYVLGLIVFSKYFSWVLIFLVGELFSFLYLIYSTKILSEKLTVNFRLKTIIGGFIQLCSSNLISNSLLYFDRFFLQLLLGGAQVGIFYAASLIGKLLGTALQPISSVMLSYLAINKKFNPWIEFKRILGLVIIFSVLFLIISYPFVPVVLKVMYPSIARKAIRYSFYANLSSMLLIGANLIQPILLKFIKLYWQNVVQISYAAIYLVSAYYLTNDLGLSGFILASIISNTYRFILFITICYVNLHPREEI